MTAIRRSKKVVQFATARKPEKKLPAVDYSGDLSDDEIRKINESVRDEIDSGNWKTIGEPAW